MKYKQVKILDEIGTRVIDANNINEVISREFVGKIFCPGQDCTAALYMVHNPKDGGKTIFFRATNEEHIDNCPYKNENYKVGQSRVTSLNGIYTEGQINDYVRSLYKDLNTPSDKKNKSGGVSRKKKKTTGTDAKRTIIIGGRIISGGDTDGEAKKGKMSRRYSVSESDIGAQVGVYGDVEIVCLDKYGQIHIKFSEDRYNNIEVLIGQVYKNLNEQEFSYMDKMKSYIQKLLSSGKKVDLVAGGLVTKYNDQLTLELQAKYSFRINGHTILDIIRNKY